MKLDRRLTIGQTEYHVIEERVLLVLNDAGTAQFLIDGKGDTINEGSAVAFDIGYASHETMSQLFLGYVEQSVKVDSRRVRLFCREWAHVLKARLPLSLRHPTLKDVLTAMHAATGLNFALPEQKYSTTKVPHFDNVGNGYQAIRTLGRVFKIDDVIWQQQGQGVIYVGSWADSRWPDRAVTFPESLFKAHLSSKSAEIAAIESLRPGVLMNNRRLTRVEFSGSTMIITWA